MFFFPLLIFTNMLILISSSWLSMWMIMEMNLILFIFIILFNTLNSPHINLNYFLVQTFNSYIYLLTSLMMNLNKDYENLLMTLMIFSMLNKLGLPPFYLWYLKFLTNSNWMTFFVTSSIQKFIPLMILSQIMLNLNSQNFILFLLIFSSFYSAIKGLNLINLKSLFTYSSIIQISWIIMLMTNNELMMIMYFLIYSIINLNINFLFNKFNLDSLNKLMNLKFFNKNLYFFYMILILSLSGIPPFFGFMNKLISIQSMSNMMNTMTLIMMIMNSLISMFFYIRIIINSSMNYHIINKINFKFLNFKNLTPKFNLMNLISIMFLMIMEMF